MILKWQNILVTLAEETQFGHYLSLGTELCESV